jgi:ubiquinone/menaquinone biosynthesis C-methylase UbiE
MAPHNIAEQAEINARVQAQFGRAAAAYRKSAVHRDPEALRKVVELAQPHPSDIALDVATGAGHVALPLAPHVGKVIAYDMTEDMLQETARSARERRLDNLTTQKGIAEQLPFAEATFDIITVRYAPHHFADLPRAVREMARVAKRGARIVVVDSYAPADPLLDRQWNHMEKLRDPSHVRNYRPDEWREMMTAAGLRITLEELGHATLNGQPMDFADWVRTISAPASAAVELGRLFRTASPAFVEAFRVETQGDKISFCVPQITLAARR